jgi:hypothetical protein
MKVFDAIVMIACSAINLLAVETDRKVTLKTAIIFIAKIATKIIAECIFNAIIIIAHRFANCAGIMRKRRAFSIAQGSRDFQGCGRECRTGHCGVSI